MNPLLSIFSFRNRIHLGSSTLALLTGALLAQPLLATTYISSEPIPSGDVVGATNLAKIEALGFPKLRLWAAGFLDKSDIVERVIDTLTDNGAISTVNEKNTRIEVSSGGFQGVTDPTFVLTIKDSGSNAVSAADVAVLDNILGYVLNQNGNAHFSPDNPGAYDFPLEYAVVTFKGRLSGVGAKGFFDYLGTIDTNLWTGANAGFTQIAFNGSSRNNSMIFLQPSAPLSEFVTGLYTAATTTPRATYVTLDSSGQPTTATAGVSFPFNDWVQFPNGDQYLAALTNPSPTLLAQLAALRQVHLNAVSKLLNVIDRGEVRDYVGDLLDSE